MIDIHEDKKQSESWQEANPENALMSIKQLLMLAINGLDVCDDYCGSRERLGQENCFCVRANFPTQNHYFLYLELRELAKKLAAFALTAELSKETHNTTKEAKTPTKRKTNYEI